MSATVFIGRDNAITLRFLQDGGPPLAGAIERVSVWIPASAFSDNVQRTVDSDSLYVTLSDDGTSFDMTLGALPFVPGNYRSLVTAFDSQHSGGIAWGEFFLKAVLWPV